MMSADEIAGHFDEYKNERCYHNPLWLESAIGLPILVGTMIGAYFASRDLVDRHISGNYLEIFYPSFRLLTSFAAGSGIASATLKGIETIVNSCREKIK